MECETHSYGEVLLEFPFVGGLSFLALFPLPSSCQAARSWLVFSQDHGKKHLQRHDVMCAGACLWSERVPVSLTCGGSAELIPDAVTCIVTHWHECVESLHFPRLQKHENHHGFPAQTHEGAGSC